MMHLSRSKAFLLGLLCLACLGLPGARALDLGNKRAAAALKTEAKAATAAGVAAKTEAKAKAKTGVPTHHVGNFA